MKAGLAAATLTILGLATAVWAEAPVSSPVPPARPALVVVQPADMVVALPTLPTGLIAPTTLAPAASPLPAKRMAAAPATAPGAILTASALAPTTSPIPLPRPTAPQVTRFTTPDLMVVANPSRSAPLSSLIPRARPDDAEDLILTSAPAPKPKTKIKASRKGSVCGNPAIRGEEIAVIKASVKGCGLSDGVKVTSVAGVQLSTPAQLDCATAEALNSWVENALIPAVGSTGGGVVKIQVAASYACRPRNNQKGNRISEHGRGRAIDVAAIVLENGKSISVLSDWGKGKGGKILKAVRKAACGTFSTVLGPGSDRFHRDHLHLDTARGRGAYCR